MFYSKTTGGFYDSAIHGDDIPADVVEITHEEHQALINGQSSGKHIVADSDGKPVLADPPAPTQNPRIAEIHAELSALDLKLIRPLSEGETDRVAELVAQKAVLRDELKAL